MPTRRGQAMLAAAVACFIVGRTLGIAELYTVSLACVLIVAGAVGTVRWARYRLGFTRTVTPGRTFPDEAVRIELVVRNVGRIGSPPLLVEDQIPEPIGGPARYAVGVLTPGDLRKFSVERRTSGRGRDVIGPLRVRLVDPFGLAELPTTNRRETSL